MSDEVRFEGKMAAAVRATARLLDVSPRDALYVAAVYLGSSMVRSMEEEGKDLVDLRDELRGLVECFESCEIDGVVLARELEELCFESAAGLDGLRH